MLLEPKRNRPGRRTEAITRSGLAATASETSLTLIALTDEVARHVDGTFVVVVKTTAGRHRRRCFLSVKAAQNAAERAVERGEGATVYLAELKPLWMVRGGESR